MPNIQVYWRLGQCALCNKEEITYRSLEAKTRQTETAQMAQVPACPYLREPLNAGEDGDNDAEDVGPGLCDPWEAVQDDGRDQKDG